MALHITDQNASEYFESGKLTIVDFWAEWCGPCQRLTPTIEALAEKYEGQVYIGKYNVDEGEDLAAEYRVRNIPMLIFVKNGELLHKIVGLCSQADIEAKIEELR